MSQAVQVKCPSCQNALRVPANIGDVCLKCKFCGYLLQLKKKAAAPTPPPASTGFPTAPYGPSAMPEYTPPAAPPTFNYNQPPIGAPPAHYPQPLVETLPDAGPSSYNPAFEDAGKKYKGRGKKYKGPSKNAEKIKWIIIGVVVLAGVGVSAAMLVKSNRNRDANVTQATDKENKQTRNDQLPTDLSKYSKENGGVKPTIEKSTGPMPRRMLAISITNYLYANSLQYGAGLSEKDSQRRDFFKSLDRLATGWRIPKEQTFYLTDGPVAEGKTDWKYPPLKMMVEGMIDAFLESCRPQDRIVLVFAGHAIEVDGVAYLVPLEGELEEINSLIPLKKIYDKLAECPAQEKLVIFDVCRFDPGRGVERPAFGKMSEPLEKALHESPEGVSVWTSCSKDEFAFEYEYAQVSVPEVRSFEFRGSVFFALFAAADNKGIFGKRFDGTAMHDPKDPLPIKPLSEFIERGSLAAVKDLEGKTQHPKLTYKPPVQAVPYNASEALAAKFEKPTPPPTAKRETVVALFNEVQLPPLKSIRKTSDDGMRFPDTLPFKEQDLKDYADDGPKFDEIQKDPAKFMKDYPLRVATVNAMVKMRELRKNANDELPESFKAPITDAMKKTITDKYQRVITDTQSDLEELRENLDSMGKKKEMEKSKRWLANYDYTFAQVKARLAYIFEYNLALGNVKLEKLPELDPKIQKGWRLASVEKMVSPKDIRDLAQEAKDAMAEIVKEHPNTPWAVLSKTQRHAAFGLQWQPQAIEQ